MIIGDKTVGEGGRPYIIAEIGVNHEGSRNKAVELIGLAKEGGADAAKFQSYKAETLTVRDSPSYWDLNAEPTTSQFELFKKYDAFEPDDYKFLANVCEDEGIHFLSTPFDDESVDFLAPLVPAFKIASADITNTPLLRLVAAKGKPVILSVGAANLEEISQAVLTLEAAGCSEISLLHCVLNYPTENRNANLNMILGMTEAFPGKLIGYSDHTRPDSCMTAVCMAYLLGARIIEKHFTHDKTLPGNDHYHAMDVEDLKVFIDQVEKLILLSGQTNKAPLASEDVSRLNARRSIVISGDVAAGTVLNESHLIAKRPGTGISPLHWDEVLGRKASRTLKDDHILQWEDMD